MSNSFIFSWDIYGIEGIIPIDRYEHWDQENLLKLLANKRPEKNPLETIVKTLILRASYNSQRQYEIYAVACDESCDEEFWQHQWKEYPQETADLVRERGHKLYSGRIDQTKVKIK